MKDPKPGQLIVIAAESQGCADIGLCYPPTVQRVALRAARSGRGGRGAEPSAEADLVQLTAFATQVGARCYLRWRAACALCSSWSIAGAARAGGGHRRCRLGAEPGRMRAPCSPFRFRTRTGRPSRCASGGARCLWSIFGRPGARPAAKRCRNSFASRRELGPQGVQFVGIAVDQADKVAQFAKELDLNYPALIGGYDAVDLSKPLGNRLAGPALYGDP